MPWIRVIAPEDAEGDLAALYAAIGTARGGVARVHQIQSLNAKAMKAHLELYKAIVFQRSSLSRIQRERIAVVVSSANECAYCVAHHAAALRSLGDEDEIVAALEHGEIEPGAVGNDAPLLEWAARRTREPWMASTADIEMLGGAGFDDRAILDATLTLGYFNFVNRLVLCLGVHLEEDYDQTCKSDST